MEIIIWFLDFFVFFLVETSPFFSSLSPPSPLMEEAPAIRQVLSAEAEWMSSDNHSSDVRDRLVQQCLRAVHEASIKVAGIPSYSISTFLRFNSQELETFVRLF